MNLRDLVTRFRERVDDLAGDVIDPQSWENDDAGLLWSNAEATAFANEAEREYARRRPIRDAVTASVCQIAVSAGTAEYPLHSAIEQVVEARLAGEAMPLTKTTTARLDDRVPNWRTYTGTPTHYLDDQATRTIRLYRTPLAAGTVDLVVDRLPLVELRWAYRHSDTPEIPEADHALLIEFMLYRAYQKRDAETYRPDEAERALAAFDAAVGPRPSERLAQVRYRERNLRRRVRGHYF